jgi:hypothetical protein
LQKAASIFSTVWLHSNQLQVVMWLFNGLFFLLSLPFCIHFLFMFVHLHRFWIPVPFVPVCWCFELFLGTEYEWKEALVLQLTICFCCLMFFFLAFYLSFVHNLFHLIWVFQSFNLSFTCEDDIYLPIRVVFLCPFCGSRSAWCCCAANRYLSLSICSFWIHAVVVFWAQMC